MSKRIPRLEMEQLPADLAAALQPRVERLGYLGEFFKCAAQQPDALRSFMQLTDDLKHALPDDITEIVALTVAGFYENSYERHQHERLCRKFGFSDEWIRGAEAFSPQSGELSPAQSTAQKLTFAVLARRGRDVAPIFEALIDAVGAAEAMAVLMLIGRYVTHSLIVNVLDLAPPVPSIFADTSKVSAKARSPLWITEAEVRSLLTLDDAISALEDGLRRESRGEAINMEKTHAAWDGKTLHAIGAVFRRDGFAGTKTWAHTEKGASPVVMLFDAENGSLLAVIEAFALGQLRTGGISAVATRWLAAESADELAIIGSGKQALMQVRAVNAVRPLRRVRVFSPTAAHRREFVDTLRANFEFEVVEADSVASAVAAAPIITLITRATEPFLMPEMVAAGAHVNAVGAITLNRAEVSPHLFPRCRTVAADSVPAVQALSRELREYYDTRGGWDEVKSLSEIVAHGVARPTDGDITLFKAMGMGISDLSLAAEIYRRAEDGCLGRRV